MTRVDEGLEEYGKLFKFFAGGAIMPLIAPAGVYLQTCKDDKADSDNIIAGILSVLCSPITLPITGCTLLAFGAVAIITSVFMALDLTLDAILDFFDPLRPENRELHPHV